MKGLFNSLYGTIEKGVYEDLYSRKGSSSSVKSVDIRLGQFEGEEDEEDDDEDENSSSLPEAATATKVATESFFDQEFLGMPNWLVGVFLLGFAYAYKSRKKS